MNKRLDLSKQSTTCLTAILLLASFMGSVVIATPAQSAEYKIDTQGAHAFIQFKVSHLGYSFVMGRFNDFSGEFNFDSKNINAANVNVTINTQSVDSNHAERDKHLRGKDFLNTKAFPSATFVSTSVVDRGDKKFIINGELTFNGVTKPISIDAVAIGEGKDPWGGYRAGFSGSTRFKMKDYAMRMDLGPSSAYVDLTLVVEGIKQ